MHGLQNHFVIVDQRSGGRTFDKADVVRICDPHVGVGGEQLLTGFVDREVGDPFEFGGLALAQFFGLGAELLDLRLAVADGLFAAFERLDLAVEILLLLGQALFDARGFGAAFLQFGFERVAEGEGLFLCLQQELFLTCFGLSEDPAGLLLCLLQ